ncbi:Abi family protein [Mannheimia indoligenes]|uniref:Abi family protein n=1 Tax=Mannheimia indoligenes TaxID=3103145 RepID=UPI002FE50057
MMIEMLTWGELSHLYSGLLEKYQKPIAQHFGVQAPILESWLKVLNDVRNICAHHSRLWNREFGRIIKIPIQKEYMGIPQNWELDSFWDKALR